MTCLQRYKNWYLVLVLLIFSSSYFYRNSISAIADVLEREFATTSTGIGMLSSFLYGSYFTMQLVVGLLLEIFSYHILVLFSSFFLGISMIAFSLTSNVTMGIIIRFVSGFIVAPPYISGIAMSSQLFGNKYVPMYSGLMFFGGNLFVFLIGYLQAYIYDEYNDWRWLYRVFGMVSIALSLIFAMFTVYEYKYHHKLNQSGALLAGKSDISLKPSIDYQSIENETDRGNDQEADDETTMNQKESFWHFVVYRHRKLQFDVIKQKLLRSLKLTVTNKMNYYLGIHAFCYFVIIFAMNGLWVINYLMVKYEYSRELSAIISGEFFMGTAVGSLIFGKLGHIFARRIPLLVISVLLMTTATLTFIYFTDKDTPIWIVMLLSGMNGLGAGSSTPIQYILVREYNHEYGCEDTATGFVNVQRTSSGFIAQLLMGVMIDLHWQQRGGNDYDIEDPTSRHYSASDFEFAFSLCTAAVVVSVLLLFVMKETHGKNLRIDKGG